MPLSNLLQPPSGNGTLFAFSAFAGYVCLVRALRWRRYNETHRLYQTKYEDRTLTPEEAQEVMHLSCCYDMPFLLNYSLAFAFFKTYAIPSISKILLSTKQLSSSEMVAKRYTDTEIMIATCVGCPISGFLINPPDRSQKKEELDPRAMITLARVNWLHSHYNISNVDYLYTLCLFVLEPTNWAARYGWRPFSPLEKYAYYVFWAEIGRRMGIQDIPVSFEEMCIWMKEYEDKYMTPVQSNNTLAKYTIEELVTPFPNFLGIKQLARNLSICALDESVRIAMMQPAQPWYLHAVVYAFACIYSVLHGWLCLPRKEKKLPIVIPLPKDVREACPRLYPTKWASRPWYKPESMGLQYVIDWLAVKAGYYHDMPSRRLKSGGYRLEEMGPMYFEGKGQEEVKEIAERLQGCPISGPWAVNITHEKRL